MLPIRLNTHRYPSGYRPLGDARPGILLADPLPREPFVREAPDLEDLIFIKLVNCRTDHDFLEFANGFFDEVLVGIGEPDPEGRVTNLPSLAMELRLSMFETVMGARRDGETQYVNGLLESAQLRPRMTRVDGVARLVLEAASVRDFMALEAASAYEAGAQMNACSHCDKVFLFGPYTGRRSHGKYCSDRCRVAAMRARNASKKVDP